MKWKSVGDGALGYNRRPSLVTWGSRKPLSVLASLKRAQNGIPRLAKTVQEPNRFLMGRTEVNLIKAQWSLMGFQRVRNESEVRPRGCRRFSLRLPECTSSAICAQRKCSADSTLNSRALVIVRTHHLTLPPHYARCSPTKYLSRPGQSFPNGLFLSRLQSCHDIV